MLVHHWHFPPTLSHNPAAHTTDTHLDHDPYQSLYESLSTLTLANTIDNSSNTGPATNPPATTDHHNHHHHHHHHPPPATQPQDQQALPPQQANATIPITPLFPPGDNVIFAHSSFFRLPALPGAASPDLPSPAQVRAEATRLGINDNDNDNGSNCLGAKLVAFPSHGLLVKYGPENGANGGVSAAEGKAMTLARRALLASGTGTGMGTGMGTREGGAVPVPEVFGWRRDAETKDRFVYMALPAGEVLEERWAGLGEGEREGVCSQLRGWVQAWRRLRLGGVGFIGSVDNGPLRDEVFRGCTMAGASSAGPFPTAAAFHDYFVTMAVTVSQNKHAGAGGGQVRYIPQHLFPSDLPIVFTHGSLHPRNIIVSAGPNPQVVAIIGWEQAGWYPAYWELCKARSECSRRGRLGGWESKYLPWILDVDGLNAELREWNVGALCQYWDYFVGLM